MYVAPADRVVRQLVTEPPSSPPAPSLNLYIVSFASGSVLLAVLAAIAIVCCVMWRCLCRRRHGNTRLGHVTGSGFVVDNPLNDLAPVQVESMDGHRVRYMAQWNCLVEKGVDELSTSQSSSASHTTPSYSDFSSHFHPPPPAQAHLSQPPAQAFPVVMDPLCSRRRSFNSNPEDILNAHPRFACKLTKSHSCMDTLNKSYGLTTFVNAVTIATSSPSLCSSHTPIQANRTPSPALSGRVAILRRFFGLRGGSIRSTVSDQSSVETNYQAYTHYETPV